MTVEQRAFELLTGGATPDKENLAWLETLDENTLEAVVADYDQFSESNSNLEPDLLWQKWHATLNDPSSSLRQILGE